MEDSLRAYVMTEECRRVLVDEYFDNPPHDKNSMAQVTTVEQILILFSVYLIPCCDNCLRHKNPGQTLLIINLLHAVFNSGGAVDKPMFESGGEDTGSVMDGAESVVSCNVIEGSDSETESAGHEENQYNRQQSHQKKTLWKPTRRLSGLSLTMAARLLEMKLQ